MRRNDAGYVTAHSPAVAIVGTTSGGERYGWVKSPRSRQSRAKLLDRLHDQHPLLDRVHRPALAPVSLRDLRVARPPGNFDLRIGGAAAGDPDVEPGGLGDDARVGAHSVGDRSGPARAR